MEGTVFEALPASDEAAVRERYYLGERIPSPVGGELEPVGVRPGNEDTAAVVILECTVSSVRYGLAIPPATSTERRKVREMLRSDEEPHCPRHGPTVRLTRVGESLACRPCGSVFATVR